jgi:hypothetical protein
VTKPAASSSTVSGCTPAPGIPGSTCSPRRATHPWHRAGLASPETAELARAHQDRIAGYGIEEVTTYYADIIDKLPAVHLAARPRSVSQAEAATPPLAAQTA